MLVSLVGGLVGLVSIIGPFLMFLGYCSGGGSHFNKGAAVFVSIGGVGDKNNFLGWHPNNNNGAAAFVLGCGGGSK